MRPLIGKVKYILKKTLCNVTEYIPLLGTSMSETKCEKRMPAMEGRGGYA